MRPRPLTLGLCLAFAACATTRPPAPAPTARTGAIDPALFGSDAAGLTDTADRLCAYLTSQDQKRLGFALARRARELAPADKAAALALARCAYFVADWAPDAQSRLSVAQVGTDAAIAAGAKEQEPRAAYYYALILGLTMRDRGLDALAQIPDEIAALESARANAAQDQGGPLRVLGMLYLKAPAWPAGPGDLELSLELLQEAAEKYPSHPLNHSFYAEALKEDGKADAADAQLKAAMDLARPELWGDYAARWQGEAQALAK